jgi:hypothetical protein
LTGVAVKVTGVSRQILFWLTVIDTPAGKGAYTIIVTILEVAGLPVMHERLDVKTTHTWSPLTGVQV